MKAISLWEPWASLIRCGAKTIETRSWITYYRGPIAIHAAKRCVRWEIADLLDEDDWQSGLAPLAHDDSMGVVHVDDLAFGCIVAICNLHCCVPTEQIGDHVIDREGHFGNYMPGRFAWCCTAVRALREPLPYKGRQGLFNIADTLITDDMLLPGTLTLEVTQ